VDLPASPSFECLEEEIVSPFRLELVAFGRTDVEAEVCAGLGGFGYGMKTRLRG
jgi:hypothetical protein